MTFALPEGNPVYLRALVVGLFGGVSLVLTHLYSRRGPLLFPVYAAILLASTLMMAQFPGLSFNARFAGALLSLGIATACSLTEVTLGAAKRTRARTENGEPPLPNSAPWLGMPIVVGTLAAAGAGAAAIVR